MDTAFDIEKILGEMTLEEKAMMCSGRDFWRTQDVERLGIPSVMVCDGPNGLRKQLGQGDHLGINESIETVCYPTSAAMASSFDVNLMQQLGELLGQECQAEHVGMLLGPGINMKRSPLCGRNFEYFSEDPYLAGKMASGYIQGLQSQGISACVKHFVANNQETRRMSGTSNMEERTLWEIYAKAFEIAVKEGKTRGIMCAYNALNGIFCSENKKLLTDILRTEWGFNGIVVTDWGATKDRIRGIESGVDLEMPGSAEESTKLIVQAVKNDTLSVGVLDQAVRNVLRFVKDAVTNQKENATFDREQAKAKSGEFEKECAVLMKNNGVLPIQASEKVAFIGEFAIHPRYQGAGSSHINEKHPLAAMDCVQNVAFAKGYELNHIEAVDYNLIEEAKQLAAESDTAVIFAGLPEIMESEGCDREHMRLPENQNTLIRAVAEVQKNTVVVLHCGAPAELPWADEVAAILCMYLGGSNVGEAAADLLYGKANPSGKLAETWPLRLEDNPSYLNFPGENGVTKYKEELFIGYRYYDKRKMNVRFPFGHGLSYTTFEYSALKFDRESIGDGETLQVSCRVKNTGTVFGKEAVQLYVGKKDSTVIRPIRELKGFQKISLKPGEQREVVFMLQDKDFTYYEEAISDWFTEPGDYTIEVGASSRDIRLSGYVNITTAKTIPLTFTMNSTMGEMMKTPKGAAILAEVMGQGQGAERSDELGENIDALGEGSREIMAKTMEGMPLNSLVNYGAITMDQLNEILKQLNE